MSITGLVSINANEITSDLYNETSGNYIKFLNGCRSNIQDQIDNIGSGASIASNLSINSLTTTSTINAGGNISTSGSLSGSGLSLSGNIGCNNITCNAINLNGSDVATTLNNKQNTITYMTDLNCHSLNFNGSDLETSINGKQRTIDASSNLVCNAILLNGSDVTDSINGKQNTIDSSSNLICNSIIANGTDILTALGGKVNSITCGTTTTLDPGEDAYIEQTGTPQDPVLNFFIPRGDRGARGARGSDGSDGKDGMDGSSGSSGSSPDVGGIIAGVISAVGMTAIEGQIVALQAQVLALDASVLALDVDVATLNAKTIFQSVVGIGTRFTSEVQVNNGLTNDVVLKPGERSEFHRGIHSGDNVDVDGTITAMGAISTNDNFSASGDLVVNGDCTLGTLGTSHTITGTSVTINAPFIELNGFVSGNFFTSSYFNQFSF